MNPPSFFVVLLVLFASGFETSYAEFRLLLIHNNDMHARFEQTNTYGAPCPPTRVERNLCYGGFARMKTAIKGVIEEANRSGIPYIVLNAGDSFQGTPYYDTKKWRMVQPLLENLHIDVMTLGNHEFDEGISSLAEYLKNVKIPVVCSNLNLTTEPQLAHVKPSKVFNVNGTKIGVVGFLTPATMSLSRTENLMIVDEIWSVREEAKRLKNNGINIIIGLGHSGFDREVEIAREIPELSLIVGGHSHSLLHSPKDKPPSVELAKASYPFMVTQKSGKMVPVVQAGSFTKYLGKLMVLFDDNGTVISATGNSQLLNSSVIEDPEMKTLIDQWTSPLREDLKAVKGYTRVPLLLSDFIHHEYESNLGNFVTDVIVDYNVRRLRNNCNDKRWTSAAISIVNIGAVRSQIEDSGPITKEDVLMVIPFANKIYEVQYKGWVIRDALEQSVKNLDDFRYYLYFSGLKVTYDLTKNVGNRISSLKVLCTNCSIPRYEVLQDNNTYAILISQYLMNGGHEFSVFKNEKLHAVDLGIKDTDIIMAYIERTQVIYPVLDGRIMVRGSTESSIFNV